MRVIIKSTEPVPVSRRITGDGNLSLAAKGLFLFLVNCREGVEISNKLISKYNKNGQASISTAMEELINAGYAKWDDSDGLHLQNGGERHKPVQRVKEATKEGLSKEEYIKKRTQEREEFIAKVQEVVAEIRPPKPPDKLIKEFVNYWASIDDFNPKKQLRYKSQKTFKVLSRIRTFQKFEREKKQDRL